MTAASNSEARKRLADPTPHTDPTAAAVRAAQAEALREAADEWENEVGNEGWPPDWLRDRADRLATDTAAPEVRPRCPRCGPGYRVGDDGCRHGQHLRCTHAAPVAVEGVETVETLAEVRTLVELVEWGVLVDGDVQPWRNKRRAKEAIEDRARLYRDWHDGAGYRREQYAEPGRLAFRTVRVSEWSPVGPETTAPEGGGSRG